MQYAPIALFTYNRPDKTKTVIESLLKNAEAKDSDLFIFSDGPKNEKAAEGVRTNREYIHTLADGMLSAGGSFPTGESGDRGCFKSITIIEREKNWGLANSLIAGITELCEKYGRVIVVEDDLILSPYFLRFMNDGLNKYEKDDRVSAISGFLNPIDCEAPETFFLRYFACWGWATWKRAWDLLNTDARDLLRQIRWKKNEFDIGNVGGFYGILYCQKVGLVDSWAILFYASSFLSDKLILYPGKTLSIQNGDDGTGTHATDANAKDNGYFSGMKVSQSSVMVRDITVKENIHIYNSYSEFYGKRLNKWSVKYQYGRFKSFIRRLINIDCK